MTWAKFITGRCAGIFIAFTCSLLVLYTLSVQYTTTPVPPLPTDFKVVRKLTSRCQKEHVILRTAGPEICLGTHNVFFIETAQSTFLNPRQACAVESAARHHPTYDIMVLMSPNDAIDFGNGVMKVMNSIDNVKVVKIDIANLVYGTPYYTWYMSNIWKTSPYKITHMSDGMRFFLLWTYGGIYLDMDVVVLRPLSSLRNTVVSESGINAGSAVMFFDRGHEIVGRFMSDFVTNYAPNDFAANGPRLIFRNILKYCNIKSIPDIKNAKCGVDVLPQDRAYPIPYYKWEDYFVPTKIVSLDEKFNSSYLIHAWNFLSGKREIVIGSNCLYEVAMKENCPLIYKYAQKFKHI